ncbi:MAG: hypothetical protein IPO67_10395 [Deltaproteobacteria bacterium]|nr:hypothetical protein [Deltaproteobacteria bacterium]MBK9371466.1 hypothetical protein [Deltaproteobacteria bacterium]MBK9645541.1 hypothetical protein [Deltaproteobacteria bacterium]
MTSPPRALLLGSPSRLPFNGHLRRVLDCEGARVSVAARVAASSPPEESWAAVSTLWAALDGATGRDRGTLCRDAWERLLRVDRAKLGPGLGADLTLLMVAEDAEGELVSGCGLGLVLAVEGADARELVDPRHPLLGEPGLPDAVPRALGPDRRGEIYIGMPTGLNVNRPAPPRLFAACGVR